MEVARDRLATQFALVPNLNNDGRVNGILRQANAITRVRWTHEPRPANGSTIGVGPLSDHALLSIRVPRLA
jgi:hypothetical protein